MTSPAPEAPKSIAAPGEVSFKGNGWKASLPPAAFGALVTAVTMALTRQPAQLPEDSLREIKACTAQVAVMQADMRRLESAQNQWQSWAGTQISLLLVRTDPKQGAP